jgi:hypothetical protein
MRSVCRAVTTGLLLASVAVAGCGTSHAAQRATPDTQPPRP